MSNLTKVLSTYHVDQFSYQCDFALPDIPLESTTRMSNLTISFSSYHVNQLPYQCDFVFSHIPLESTTSMTKLLIPMEITSVRSCKISKCKLLLYEH